VTDQSSNDLLEKIIDLYHEKKTQLSRISDICEKLKDQNEKLVDRHFADAQEIQQLREEIDDLRTQLDPDPSEVNPDYDSDLNDLPISDVNPDYDSIIQPAGTTPTVPLSCAPGFGLGISQPDLSFMTIRPPNKLTIKSDIGPAPVSNITWDDYHTGG